MKLSVIIVSWNVKEKLKENLTALFKSQTNFDFEVFVVDNNSEDGTLEMVQQQFREVNLIDNEINFGFGKANNQVIRQLDCDYALLINPDNQVKKDTLQGMVDWMEKNQQASVAGCKLIDETGRTIKHVRRFPCFLDQLFIVLKVPHLIPGILKKYLLFDFDYEKATKVDSIRGGFFMLNLNNIADLKMYLDRTLPLFDSRYFLWFEEVDYCKQIYKSGGEVWYTPVAECIDHVGQSFKQLSRGQAQNYFQNSMLKYFKKWHSFPAYLILKIAWPTGKIMAVLGEKFGIKNKKVS